MSAEFIEWVADKILEGVSEANHSDFLAALKDRREDLILFYHPKMFGMHEKYVFDAALEGHTEILTFNADPEDPDLFYTVAKKAVDHLRGSLLDETANVTS